MSGIRSIPDDVLAVVIYDELITTGMYPRRYALCVRDDVGNKDHSRLCYGASGNGANFQRLMVVVIILLMKELVVANLMKKMICRTDIDPTIVERPVMHHVTDNFIDDVDEHLDIMSYTRNNFLETDAMFLEFEDNLDNLAGGSSSVDDNATWSSSQPPTTTTLRRHTQSRLLELECHVAVNGRIPMTIVPGAEKPISPHVVRFSQRFFVLDFNDHAMNRFVEHQMLTTFKEFQGDCHRHFKKYSNPEEARANPPNNQMLELQSQPTLEGTQPLFEDEICNQVLVDD
ncbi:CACTA en-spm transposon protein [Cucumis melo var. makuwa]|uniref:CACTA en-spm transposon protein n=1 Tax=Cucumis melo var. makuwa TaxID=1194695 RepID=A0A5D3BXD7_CUCMM|nr:CACTA en-spm transposon protein [Cucumis melo var. makuwa]TYK04177.1 CACTA en-spm transposon protein [Cucumis melo var. makuwa]